jgi:hypothetical protein
MAAIPNPRYAGAPAHMSDGRSFTDYRPSCSRLAPLRSTTWADHERRQTMQNTGEIAMNSDRMVTTMRAGSTQVVDTMVPELTKALYTWQGGAPVVSQPVGIGGGRLYLPGRPDLLTADPDSVAAATFPALPGTWTSPMHYKVQTQQQQPPTHKNRYAMPYGN